MVTAKNAREVSDAIVRALRPISVITFGSVAKNGVGADLDLLVIIDDEPEMVEEAHLLVYKCLKEFYKKFPIDPFIISKSVFSEYYSKGGPLLKEGYYKG